MLYFSHFEMAMAAKCPPPSTSARTAFPNSLVKIHSQNQKSLYLLKGDLIIKNARFEARLRNFHKLSVNNVFVGVIKILVMQRNIRLLQLYENGS